MKRHLLTLAMLLPAACMAAERLDFSDLTADQKTSIRTALDLNTVYKPTNPPGWSVITGKPTTLSGYGITDAAALSHTHALSNLTQSGATSGQVAAWNGSAWAPATPSGGTWGSITGTLSSQTDLNTELEGKAAAMVGGQGFAALKVGSWVANSAAGSAPPVRLLIVGDSLSTGLTRGPNMGLAGVIGLRSYNRSGTVTLHPPGASGSARHDYWITGGAETYAVGSSGEYTVGGSANGDIRGDQCCVGYVTGPGRGSFNLEYQANGTGSWTSLGTINTSNATTAGGYSTFNLPATNAPYYRLRVNTVTTGDVTVLMTGIYNTNAVGIIQIFCGSVGGIDIGTHFNATPDAIFSPVWAGLAPDVVVSCWADAASNWEAGGAWRTFYSKAKAAYNKTDFIQISRNPSYEVSMTTWATSTTYTSGQKVVINTGDKARIYECTSNHTSGASTQPGVGGSWATVWVSVSVDSAVTASSLTIAEEQATAQRAWAVEANETFISQLPLFVDWNSANEKGLMADNVHPSTSGNYVRNRWIWTQTPIGSYDLGALNTYENLDSGMNASISSISGNIASAPWFFNRPITLTGTSAEISMHDSASPYDNTKKWRVFPSNSQLNFYMGSSRGGYFDMGSGLAGFYPGGNNWALGSTSARWNAFAASASFALSAKTANYTLTGNDFTITCDATAGSFAVTVPSASSHSGRVYVVKRLASDVSGNTVTLTGTIDGTSNPTLSSGQSYQIQSTGSAWVKIN